MHVYENCRSAIRISYLGFALIALGFLIQNENVNIFYTFTSPFILMLAEGCLRLGKAIIHQLPLIFMLCFVCKKANSGFPVVLALIGYYTYMTVMSLFANQNLPSQCYSESFIFTMNNSLPFETGLLGAFLVGYATRFSFVHSRHRGYYSFLGFLNKDTAGIIYNVVYCGVLGFFMALVYPIGYGYIQDLITTISTNLTDPRRIALYGLFDRLLSIMGVGRLIRYPFWFTSAGGSFSSSLTGQLVVGDVNIWAYIQDASSTYSGCGRFITPYYVINMFLVPAIYLGMFISTSDKKERRQHFIPMLGIMALSIVAGNPLPMELSLLFTAPLLFLIYLGAVVLIFWVLPYFSIFLGFPMVGTDTLTALPGSFPDFIINLRNSRLSANLSGIAIVGIVAAVIMLVLTYIYYNYLAYDLSNTGKKDTLVQNIIIAVGGLDNIISADNSVLRVNLELKDLELVSIDKINEIKAKRIRETKTGIGIELGTSSCLIARAIRKKVKLNNR